MSTSIAYDLAYYILNTIAKGTRLGTDMFCNTLLDSPDAAYAVFEYGGDPSARGMGADDGALENSRLQVAVRNLNPDTAQADAYAIYAALDGLGSNVTINSAVYTWLRPLQPPFLLEYDDRHRSIFAFNLECQRIRP